MTGPREKVARLRLRYLLILLFFFLALALALVMLFRAWPHSELLDREIVEVEERHLLLARNLATSLDRYAGDLHSTLGLFAKNRDIWGYFGGATSLMAPLHLRNVCVVERASGVVIDGLWRDGTPCPDKLPPHVMDGFQGRANADFVSFSAVDAAPDGTNVMYVALSVSSNTWVVGTIDTERFIQLGSAITFGVLGHAAIVDHAGNVLSHPLPDWVRSRKNIIGVSAVQRMLRGETGIDVFYSPALEADMVAGIAPVTSTGWGVMVPQPIAELEAKIAHARQSSFFVLLFGVAGALSMALLASSVTVRPLEALTRVAREVAAGELTVPGPLPFRAFQSRELRELYSGVRVMVMRLRKNQVRINKLAFFDTTTGLPNRECFRSRVEAFLKAAQPGTEAALLFIDLDGFKAVNDTMGHDVGDHVLGQVGARLNDLLDMKTLTPEQPILSDHATATSVARLGGDEFAVFLPHADADAGLALADRIRARIEVPFPYETRTLTLGASIGIACLPGDALDYTGLLKAADIAMYEVKRSGKNRSRVFSASPPVRRERRQDMAEDLFSFEITDQIEMHYQPVYAAQDMSVASVEGLIRWDHPQYGLLAPKAFFEMVAQLGLQRQIDQLAFDQAITAMSRLAAQGAAPPSLSLNTPIERLQDEAFVAAILGTMPLPFKLSLEVFEAAFCDVSADQVHWAIDRLREAGVEFELDDFGSSQAPLTAMLSLAPHRIKLDARLTAGVVATPGMSGTIASLVDMAHELEIGVVAKGVEHLDQAARLRDLGVDFLQGFALNRPLSAEEIETHMASALPTDIRNEVLSGT